jgi:hypothetical protein
MGEGGSGMSGAICRKRLIRAGHLINTCLVFAIKSLTSSNSQRIASHTLCSACAKHVICSIFGYNSLSIRPENEIGL